MKIAEAGEIKFGTIGESKEIWSLATYAVGFSITRNALINDDLNAFNDLMGSFAQGALELEFTILVDTLYGTAGFGPDMSDGNPLFDALHNNIAAAGAALSVATLGDGREAMRLQTSLSGTPINVSPATLVVPAALETTAEQLLATLMATKVADQNPFEGA